jgi:aldehyde dehydrogenase (NAD+)
MCCLFIIRKYFAGETLASTIQGEQEDVDMAVKSSKKAYESWSKTPNHVRARHLYRLIYIL